MIPIRDLNPTRRVPVITLALIAANVIVFLFWQPTFGTQGEQQLFYFCHAEIPWETSHQTNLANGGAHAATNAETQFLIAGAPNVRILFTVAEGLYRIIAKRSAGIKTLADLKGKRVVLPRDTSAHYSLVRMLASAKLSESDVTIVDVPRGQLAAAVIDGRADAISMWEPDSQNTVDGLGKDAIVFQDNKVYRELFSLYSSTRGSWQREATGRAGELRASAIRFRR